MSGVVDPVAPHNFHPTILREYDIRGIVGKTLHAADANAIGRAFGTIVAQGGGTRVAVGYDGRLSSPELAEALVEGLMSTGLAVTQIGLGPTPMLYFAVKHLKVDAGIQITGSHNPPDYNGFKMALAGGPVFGAAIQQIGEVARSGSYARGIGSVEAVDISEAYVQRLAQDMKPGGRTLNVAWDAGNGATGDILQRMVKLLPGTHHLLHEVIDGTFPAHHPDPTVPENLVDLQAKVAEEGCDLGIAFDGDGDRIGAIDGTGRIVWGDQLLALYAREVLAERPGAIIMADVKASQVLFDEIERLGGQPLMWKTGHSLLKAKMAENGAPLAGEMSGHIFFADRYYGFDDALYCGVRLVSLLAHTGKSLAELVDELPRVVNTPEIRFQVDETRKFQVIEEVRQRLATPPPGIEVNTIDGVRVNSADGWWLLRASNTQDVLVARAEAPDEAALGRLKEAIRAQLAASGLSAPATF